MVIIFMRLRHRTLPTADNFKQDTCSLVSLYEARSLISCLVRVVAVSYSEEISTQRYRLPAWSYRRKLVRELVLTAYANAIDFAWKLKLQRCVKLVRACISLYAALEYSVMCRLGNLEHWQLSSQVAINVGPGYDVSLLDIMTLVALTEHGRSQSLLLHSTVVETYRHSWPQQQQQQNAKPRTKRKCLLLSSHFDWELEASRFPESMQRRKVAK